LYEISFIEQAGVFAPLMYQPLYTGHYWDDNNTLMAVGPVNQGIIQYF
jgi:hypothetical protein